MSTFSIDGLISGFNTESIINGMVSLQARQVETFNARKTQVQVRQQALQGVEARLLSFRSKLSQLNRANNSIFENRQVQSSQENLVTAVASNQAVTGSYSIRVSSLAAAEQLGSNGFTSSSQEISTGTLSFQVGDRPATEITIDNTNNSVSGLVQAVNNQSPDISATLIRDQASGTDRILLTSKHTGASNSINIINNLAEVDGIARPDFSGPAIQSAANASIQFGSGPGAIVTEFQTNRIEGLIQGVTLNLIGANPGQDINISVSRDTQQAQQAIRDFVEEYNSLISYINEQTRFNAEAQRASPLLGNRSVSDLKNRLSAMVTESVPGLGPGLNRLSQLGLNIDSNGKLNLDNGKLNSALAGELPGVSANAVQRLFGLTGSSTTSGIEFFSGSSRTTASATPIQVNILQAAEQGFTVATFAPPSIPIEINSANNQFQISIDGVQSEMLTLQGGSHSLEQMAQHLQSVINSSNNLGNRDVFVTVDGGKLKITSQSYGSNSKVSEITGSAIASLGFDGSELGTGKDVAGSFIINGVTEQAVGTGRILVGNSDNPHTADLQVRVTLSSNQVVAGVDAEVTVTRGTTARLDKILGDYLDTQKGTFASLKKSFDDQIESIDQSIKRVNQISESKREFLVKQFATLERTLSSLQTTASIITSQLSSIQRG